MAGPKRSVLAAVLGWLLTINAPAQVAGRDIVELDKTGLTSSQQQALRSRLGKNLVLETDGAIVAQRENLATVLDAMQWPGIRPSDGVSLNPLQPLDDSFRFKRVYGPSSAAQAIELRLKHLEKQCLLEGKLGSSGYAACLDRSGSALLRKALVELQTNSEGCQSAATKYLDYLADCDFSCPDTGIEVRRDFDGACLESLIAWKRRDGVIRLDPQPQVFRTGGDRNGVAGAISAIVLVEIDDEHDNSTQHCGGLLLSGNRVLTAAHCFVNAGDQSALRSGRVFAHLIRDDGAERYRLLPAGALPSEIPPVANDYIVLKLQASTDVAAPRVELREPSAPGPAVVLGYFADYDTTRVVEGENPLLVHSWKLGLRWAKPGMCHVIESVNGCVRTLCQTIKGYSGAPIFATDIAAPNLPLVVYGLISGPDIVDAACGTVEPLTTLAASAKDVVP